MAPQTVLAGVLIALASAAPAGAQPTSAADCADYRPPHVILPNAQPFDAYRVMTLVRFHRQQEAIAELDAARAIVRGSWRFRVPPQERPYLPQLDAFRNCLAATTPPALATLTVRVLGHPAGNSEPVMLLEDARVYVEGLLVGRTDRNGTLSASVPSGSIRVDAELPVDQARGAEITLSPGQSGAIEITLDDEKEVSERTTLVLAEAVDDIIPASTRSMTLKFVRDGRLAPVEAIESVEVIDRNENPQSEIKALFRAVRGEIGAADLRRVFEALAPLFDGPIVLEVLARDAEGARYYGRVAFRVARWPLSVTLEAPPSNPTLPVSDVEVGISLPGGFAVQRVSDAQGRFEITSFPEGVLSLECEVVYKGNYYYGQGTVDFAAPTSATLVLRNLVDIVNGVTPVRVDGEMRPSRPRRER